MKKEFNYTCAFQCLETKRIRYFNVFSEKSGTSSVKKIINQNYLPSTTNHNLQHVSMWTIFLWLPAAKCPDKLSIISANYRMLTVRYRGAPRINCLAMQTPNDNFQVNNAFVTDGFACGTLGGPRDLISIWGPVKLPLYLFWIGYYAL